MCFTDRVDREDPHPSVNEAHRRSFVEFHTEAWFGWRDHIATFPLNWFHQEFSMEAAPILDGFQHQEVGRAGTQLNIGGTHNWSTIQMRSDLGVVRFCDRRNLFTFEYSATTPKVDLQYRGCPSFE